MSAHPYFLSLSKKKRRNLSSHVSIADGEGGSIRVIPLPSMWISWLMLLADLVTIPSSLDKTNLGGAVLVQVLLDGYLEQKLLLVKRQNP